MAVDRLRAAEEMQAQRAEAFSAFRAFVTRLHFYVGLFVGPFIFVAALSGVLYVLTPQLEDWLYREQLQVEGPAPGGPLGQLPSQPLSAQIAAARAAAGPGDRLFAVRPATAPGLTTRVMLRGPGLGESESRVIFVDPATLAIRGDMTAYGTSGVLPLRTTLDYLHRNLLMGDIGRHYSELAASWLWIAVIGGLLLWFWRRRMPKLQTSRVRGGRARRLHSLIGLWLAVGLLFLSVTGLTWSRWAGSNIDLFRNTVGWVTPSVNLALKGPAAPVSEHADHQGMPGMVAQPSPAPSLPEAVLAAQIDAVVAAAKTGGLGSAMLEIRPPKAQGQAWLVSEYDRRWPTQVDTVAIDPDSLAITSRADFASFPVIAKLIRWGIDAHMGVLFGFANQLLMAAIGLALMMMIAYGYRSWWLRRPAPGASARTLGRAFALMPGLFQVGVVVVTLAVGVALPVMGASLVVFLMIDLLRSAFAEMAAQDRRHGLPPGQG
ncbi:MAG: PepSY-associated TM helix domain-containing protein [Neorhizobium sp.]|nr:PepSY-associated TM helix domain-containing protein [Neorhizobium sp.]